MNCKNCGSVLELQNGYYICKNCGTKYSVSEYFENTDVFICCAENDESGRRTRDSVIASDLHSKLSRENINAFYGYISASEITGDAYEKVCSSALDSAKAVIAVGTSGENFKSIMDKYSVSFTGKTIIPVFSAMNVKDIPKEIVSFQAVDYDKIGADTDLTKSVLNILGRDSEVDLNDINKSGKKKRAVIAVTIVAIIVAVVFYLLFGTNLIINNNRTSATQSTTVDQGAEQYNLAMQDLNNGKYSEAIKLFSGLSGYKDSDKQLLLLYEKYAGYYQSDDENITFYFSIIDDTNANIEILHSADSKQIKISESVLLSGNKFSFDFVDSENNNGTVNITLSDNSVNVSIKNTKVASDTEFDNAEYVFMIENKSDKPLNEKITLQTIKEWTKDKLTLSKLQQQGYEVEYLGKLYYKNDETKRYKIKDSNIELEVYEWNLFDLESTFNEDTCSYDTIDDPIVASIIAPAQIVANDKIGDNIFPYIKENIYFMPNIELDGRLIYDTEKDRNTLGVECISDSVTEISKDTKICITSENMLPKKDAEYMYFTAKQIFLGHSALDMYLSDYKIDMNHIENNSGSDTAICNIVAEKGNKFVYAICGGAAGDKLVYYECDIEAVSCVPVIELDASDDRYNLWENYPDEFKEFIE